jgi:hypothetical protein
MILDLTIPRKFIEQPSQGGLLDSIDDITGSSSRLRSHLRVKKSRQRVEDYIQPHIVSRKSAIPDIYLKGARFGGRLLSDTNQTTYTSNANDSQQRWRPKDPTYINADLPVDKFKPEKRRLSILEVKEKQLNGTERAKERMKRLQTLEGINLPILNLEIIRN